MGMAGNAHSANHWLRQVTVVASDWLRGDFLCVRIKHQEAEIGGNPSSVRKAGREVRFVFLIFFFHQSANLRTKKKARQPL